MLQGKNIVVGVSGGIATYKVVEVVSKLVKLGANINVIMTKNATKFVTPLTFRTISKNTVTVEMFEEFKEWDVEHISMAQKADLFLIAPATANIIGKISSGIADDFLTTTIMATKAKVLFVPAMNHNMYENPIVQKNIANLKEIGYKFLEPSEGLMACGTTGKGRLPEPQNIVDSVLKMLQVKQDLLGYKVLVTAGPTKESIDPVRYITNHSSGKMGYSIAEQAVNRGAEVILITGNVNLKPPAKITIKQVETAEEMYRTVVDNYKACEIIILVAAVADYRSKNISATKLKKNKDEIIIELTKNVDIALELGKIKEQRILVGFCAETDNLIENAKVKLKKKNFDFIVANDITKEGSGFNSDTNIVSIIHKNGEFFDYEKMSKIDLSDIIIDHVIKVLGNKQFKF